EICERLNVRPEFYAAHSVAVFHGENVLRHSNAQRWAMLRSIFRGGAQFNDDGVRILLADSGNGGEFFQAVVEAGGEGVCAVNADAPWGLIYAAKPLLELKVLVTGKDGASGCLEITDKDTLQPLGRVPCKAQFEAVRTGEIVEVNCLGRHRSGKLREARFVCIKHKLKQIPEEK
ncbi:MAG: ATP-dependent DNA ligase, partial [Patescibacteria group bacterium]|nr:ATP-dependent DNA ligase [Patescibacteria group bacterium]